MRSGKRVLVVDDEEDIREGVARWLNATGYTTVTAGNGEEGMAAAVSLRPDAIVLDVQMPHMGGMEMLHHLNRDARTERIPVVMLSASLRDEQQALDAGARFFMQKPYQGQTLVSTIGVSLDN